MRILLSTTVLVSTAAPALAHVGHFGEALGHDHWTAGVALGAALGALVWGAVKGAKDDKEKAENSEETPEATPKEA